ncbi:MAG: hypothetical protein EA376_11515 [Phycisphaeraceae bacterium]|nr:MAG: hypothetical protein EA376_11515 [Phycisphaeraceae bacterium]
MQLSAVVRGAITEDGLKRLLHNMYSEMEATRNFSFHGGKSTLVFIYLYSSREHFDSGMGQWIARLSKVGANSQIDIELKAEAISGLNAEAEVRHGLSASIRKEIFKATVVAEDRARAEAEQMHPLPDLSKPSYSPEVMQSQFMKQADAFHALHEKYKSEVAEKYDISEEQLRDILIEAIKNNWPMPAHP